MTHIPSTTTRGACFVSITLKYTQNAGDYLKQVKASSPFGAARERHRTAEPTVMRFLKICNVLFEDVLGFAAFV